MGPFRFEDSGELSPVDSAALYEEEALHGEISKKGGAIQKLGRLKGLAAAFSLATLAACSEDDNSGKAAEQIAIPQIEIAEDSPNEDKFLGHLFNYGERMKVKLQKLDELRKGDGVTEEKRLAASRLFSRTLTFSIPASVDHEFTTFVAKEMSGLEYSSRADFNVTVTAENFRAEAVDLKKVFYTFSGLDAFVDTHFGDKDGQVEDDPDEVLMKDRLLIENPAMHALYKRLDIALSITGDFVKAFDAINPKEK